MKWIKRNKIKIISVLLVVVSFTIFVNYHGDGKVYNDNPILPLSNELKLPEFRIDKNSEQEFSFWNFKTKGNITELKLTIRSVDNFDITKLNTNVKVVIFNFYGDTLFEKEGNINSQIKRINTENKLLKPFEHEWPIYEAWLIEQMQKQGIQFHDSLSDNGLVYDLYSQFGKIKSRLGHNVKIFVTNTNDYNSPVFVRISLSSNFKK